MLQVQVVQKAGKHHREEGSASASAMEPAPEAAAELTAMPEQAAIAAELMPVLTKVCLGEDSAKAQLRLKLPS